MTELVRIISSNVWLLIAVFLGFWTVCNMVEGIVISVSRERTKREIAAYIAEGSMTPEEGERLVRAKPKRDASCDCG